MNEHPLTAREYEEDAVRKRLWSHAVGVINSKRVPTAHKGGKWLSEVPGSASAIKWGAHHAVLTAKHLVADLSASDLRLYTRPSGRPELAEYERSGFVPSQLGGQMVLCGWEDLALITLPANSSINLEFHDAYASWLDPEPGQKLSSFGFPTDAAKLVKVEKLGSLPHETKELFQKIWPTVVIPIPSNFCTAYTDPSPYDADRHYLVDWRPAEDLKPYGFSGAAMWSISFPVTPISKIELLFAGVATHFYKSYEAERIIKASVVRKFLGETFGPPV